MQMVLDSSGQSQCKTCSNRIQGVASAHPMQHSDGAESNALVCLLEVSRETIDGRVMAENSLIIVLVSADSDGI
jgi:hypothetical protein